MGLPQMLTTVQVARLFGAETPEEIKTRQAYLAQLRFRGQGPRFVLSLIHISEPTRRS